MFNIDSLGRILIKSGILPATARSQYEARKGGYLSKKRI